MTKDEFNEILKEQGMLLAFYRDGTTGNGFNILDNDHNILVKCNGLGIFYSSEWAFNKHVIEAMVAYINTPIEERKPKPQLYNIIIAQQYDYEHDLYYVVWRKSEISDFVVDSSALKAELNYEDYQFTQEEIDILKSKLPDIQKHIVDLGATPVAEQDKEESK